ncbi:MAG: hypothetical protein L0Z62_22560 [Gemmataceae bacterium]|nr:hypothetical protein [Gemmataceae bacterium]
MFRFGLIGRLPGALALVTALLVLGVGGGCSKGKTMGKVSGQVTYKANPITEGQVHFISKSGQGAAVNISGSGDYSAELETGTYSVYVAPHPPGQTGPPGEVKTPKQPASVIPEKYRQPETSGLTIDVKEGDNPFKIELTN